MTAQTLTIDFRNVPEIIDRPSGINPEDTRPRTKEGKLLTPKQIRARAR